MDIKTFIWNYGQLTRGQQKEIEDYVDRHPEYAPLLEDVKSVYEMLEDTRVFARETPDDPALSYFIANHYLQHHPLPDVLRAPYETMKRRIDQDPTLRDRYLAIQQRMDLIASTNDPMAQFKALTGHTLDETAVAEEHDADRLAYALDRGPERAFTERHRLRRRRLVATGLAVAASLAVLLLFTSNRIDRLAYTDPASLLLEDYETIARGNYRLPASASVDQQFIYGQAALRDAQHAWLGLYYTFDRDMLGQSRALFERVLAGSGESSILFHEATFYLGKIALANHDVEQARILLQQVAGDEGPHARNAAELLDSL